MRRRTVIGVSLLMLVAAACTSGADPAVTTTTGPVSTSATVALSTSATVDLTTTVTLSETVEVSLRDVASAAEFVEPDERIVLPWGNGPGEAGRSELMGIEVIDVAPDGWIGLIDQGRDGTNPRLQVWDGESWTVLLDPGDDAQFLPYGVAMLDSGLILVRDFRRGSGGVEAMRASLYDRSGVLVDQRRVPTVMNFEWGGGAGAWAAYGPGPEPARWVQLTDGSKIVDFDEADMVALDEELDRRLREDDRIFPFEEMDRFYRDSRLDSGVEFQVEGGQGWDNTNPLHPWVVAVSTPEGAYRWALSDWDDVYLNVWEADDERFLVVGLHDALGDPGSPYFVLDCPLGESCRSFLIERDYWKEAGTWGWARLQDGELYVVQTTPDAARIDIFHLDE